MCNFSIISDSKINNDKGGYIGYVDAVLSDASLVDFAKILLKHHITPATFTNNKRSKATAIGIDFFCFDFDNGSLSQTIQQDCLRMKWQHLIAGSKNHLKDKNDGKGVIERFHLFLPLVTPITDPIIYSNTIELLARRMKWQVDPAVKDISRYFYKHSKLLFGNITLNKIDWTWLWQEVRKENKVKKLKEELIRKSIGPIRLTSGVELFKKTKGFNMLKNMTEGQRYGVSNSIIGIMIKCGVSLNEAISLFEEYQPLNGKSYNIKTVTDRYNKWS